VLKIEWLKVTQVGLEITLPKDIVGTLTGPVLVVQIFSWGMPSMLDSDKL
jgi:hypothetical protein